MKDEHLCIANETVQQLRNFRDFINTLPLNASRKLYYTKLIKNQQLRMQTEVLELDLLKVQLFAKLQQDILNKDNFTQGIQQIMIQTQNRLMEIYEPISERLPLSEEALRIRMIIAIINFKFSIRERLTPRLRFDDLLGALQQANLWQTFLQQQNSLMKFFYLCLMWQYLYSQDIQNFMEIINLYADYLLKAIKNKQQSSNNNQQINGILVDLLHCHHSFKLFKKQYNLDYLLTHENQIYSVLYQLDYSLSEQVIYQYKKLNAKTKQQIIEATKQKLGVNIMTYDEKNVDIQLRFQEEKSKSNHGLLRPSHLSTIIHRKSSSKMVMAQQIKKKELDLKPINNLFVPKRLNPNIQLERRLQLRRQIKSTHEHMKSSSSNIVKNSKKLNRPYASKQTRIGQRQLTIIKGLGLKSDNCMKGSAQKPNYESCKKYSINKHQELQLMICERRSGVSLKLNRNGEDNSIARASIDRDRNNSTKKRMVPNRKGSIIITQPQASEFKRQSWLETDNTQIVIPSIIRLALTQYIRGFLTYFKYRHQKYSMPLYIAFQSLNKANYYYLKGEIIKFIQIQTKGLNMIVVYTKKQNQLKTVSFKLYEYNQQNVRQLFMNNNKNSKLGGFYKFGGNLTFYWFKLKNIQPVLPAKFQVSQICYEKEIYSYTVWLTGQPKSIHFKGIIEAQQRFIKGVDDSLKIDFKYDKETNQSYISNKSVKQSINLHDLLQISFQKSIHEWYIHQSIKISLKEKEKYQIFVIKQLEHLRTGRNYLLFQSSNPFKLGTQFKIIPCSKTFQLQKFINDVRSWSDITDKIKEKFIVQQNWIEVLLNQKLFDLKTTKHLIKKQPKGYQLYVSQQLTENTLHLIKGQEGKIKWFILVNLKQFQIIHKISEYKSNKIIKPNRRRSINTFGTHISIKSKKVMPSGRDATQLVSISPLKLLKKEGNKVFLGKQRFSFIEYEYSWCLYVKRKIYYCFKRFQQIFVLIIKDLKFLFIQSFQLSQHNHRKQLIFSEFRRLLELKLTSKTIVYSRWGIIGIAQVIKNSVVIKFSEIKGNYTIQISSNELYGFSSPSANLTHHVFSNKAMLKRITEISKDKLAQRLIIRS